VREPKACGARNGARNGACNGARDGACNGARDGAREGACEGAFEGAREGAFEGARDGACDGARNGACDGAGRDDAREAVLPCTEITGVYNREQVCNDASTTATYLESVCFSEGRRVIIQEGIMITRRLFIIL